MPYYAPEEWAPVNGVTLEENADTIVRSSSNYSVMAGPGAGKTELLAQRACFLLQTGACARPKKILAISLKRDSAKNLQERVIKRCGEDTARRFESRTYDAFAKGLLDNFYRALPSTIRPAKEYSIASGNVEPTDDVLTFKRVIELAIEILEQNPSILKALRLTYSHVFLDEFQDTTDTQYSLVRAAFLGSGSVLTAVGDARQRIMGFAGALPDAFVSFRADFAPTELPLVMNHRCSPVLVAVQKVIAEHITGESFDVRPSPKWPSDAGECTFKQFTDAGSEGAAVSGHIEGWLAEGVKHREICILVRQSIEQFTPTLVSKLAEVGIHARNEDDYQKILYDPLGEFFVNYLKASLKARDPEVWSSLRGTLLDIMGVVDSEQDASKVRVADRKLGETLRATQRKFRSFLIGQQHNDLLNDLIELVTEKQLKRHFPHMSTTREVKLLIEGTLNKLHFHFLSTNNWESALDDLLGKNAIPMMTIHKSKGLEFHSVVFLGFEAAAFYRYTQEVKDEDNAIFVAISRPKHRLLITISHQRILWGRNKYSTATNSPLSTIYGAFAAAGVPIS